MEVYAGASWAAEREPDRGFGGAEEENTFQGSVAFNKNRYVSDLTCVLCLLGLLVQKRPSPKLFKDKRMLYCILALRSPQQKGSTTQSTGLCLVAFCGIWGRDDVTLHGPCLSCPCRSYMAQNIQE